MRLLLVGGGHAHVEVLRQFGDAPESGLDIVLVTPDETLIYSGMLPGLIAGHYVASEVQIALRPLAAAARARLVAARVGHFDPVARTATLADGGVEAFDIASLDVGSTPDLSLPGARSHAVPVRPLESLRVAWDALQADVAGGLLSSIAIVGAGAAGVELLLAMQYRLSKNAANRTPRFVLVTDQPAVLPAHPPSVRRRIARILTARGVVVYAGSKAVLVTDDGVALADGRIVAADRVIFATGAAAAPWLAASGLACDAGGFVRVDECLRSISHPCVFAAGDCAAQEGRPRPKSGVYAVRAGPPLAANLRRAVRGESLAAWQPQRRSLALISAGDRYAVASWPPWSAEGAWVWRWKDRIDRRFVGRYRTGA